MTAAEQEPGDWLEAPSSAVDAAANGPRPLEPIEAVALRLRDVSPAWHDAAVREHDLPKGTRLPGISRDRAIGVEAIREGWLLHRGASRIAPAASPDLALLVGDWCYASGLCSIADHGSLDDVATLARLIADVSARRADEVEALEPRWTEAIEALQDA
ncbi:MAG: hypothetical protein JWM86_2744 [Thermoleophilia bacterium]|nr:hypothetical protein [Thermoleophilia bacterium]